MVPNRLNWEDLRFLLTAERANSIGQLANELSVDATTVSRRLKSVEKALGAALFERVHGRLILTEQAQQLVAHLAPMESSATAFQLAAHRLKNIPEGKVRISAPPTLARYLIAPNLGDLHAYAPGIAIDLEIDPSNVHLNLLEADIAMRLGSPADANQSLIAKKTGHAEYAAYAASDHKASTSWIAYAERYAHVPEAEWVEQQLNGAAPVLRTNDPFIMAQAVASGVGRAVLPVLMGATFPGIKQLGTTVLKRDIWLLRRDGAGLPSAAHTTFDWLARLTS